jgi:hypothetical protein
MTSELFNTVIERHNAHRAFHFKYKMTYKAIAVGMLWAFLFSGCAALYKEKIPEKSIVPELKWDLNSYAEFVKQNMSAINARYSPDYVSYQFVVDTEFGSTLIQNLIDPGAVSAFSADFKNHSNPENYDKWVTIYQYVIDEYTYILDPFAWQTVGETLKTKKGDCKSLSFLLMSLLLSAGYDAYAAISNGHMWVNVRENGQWYVLELDQSPQRRKIYRIPGFYDNPLYKVYPDRSEKRKRNKKEKSF